MINEQALSVDIENILVDKNLRGMKPLQSHLNPGYCLRAAKVLKDIKGTVLIGTGFPVLNTFETDGPVGSLILYKALKKLGMNPILVCGTPMANVLQVDYNIFVISVGQPHLGAIEARRALAHLSPEVIISIEHPGLAENNRYHNMRGEDITDKATCFDHFLTQATCPTIAIGDGGNEIGMGNVKSALQALDIIPAVTPCDELIVSDVSNWGVYGILAFLSVWSGQDLLKETCPETILKYLSEHGSVDGVTRKNELTEDGLPVSEGKAVIESIRSLIGFNKS
ncbi:glutamate cyclase domain-containing protein [Thalassotalea profundi]|uniref:D-glutamate cyclase-like C-terminal domain-containing protein n=1 Tax=Thalassotalea profundi TaxID=2036687 RepID=A0ABQ3J232_9GAMM|nr:glutamate cyclase domain-containing protein [Thalassotalea profundi]GHE98725.1 hypothetical protein GCM10011501_30360 [Thalassotalea profundi]